MLCVNSEHIALPIFLLRYVSHGAGSAQGAASRRRPLYPRALAAKIATSWYLRLISVRAKHGPQPASMRAAPAFRERLSDFEATNTGSFSSHGYKGRVKSFSCNGNGNGTGRRPGKALAATRRKICSASTACGTVRAASKSPVALPLTGATAQYGLVAPQAGGIGP